VCRYPILVKSNQTCVSIEEKILRIQRDIAALYDVHYGELSKLVQMPLEYIKAVKTIGNLTNVADVEAQLTALLPSSLVLSISVTCASSKGGCPVCVCVCVCVFVVLH
jgi:RNA processing factor Prp31